MPKITPFLWFDNQAEEAANFYASIFPNSKIKVVNRYGAAGPGPKGSVMTVRFDLDGQEFTALNGGPVFKINEAVSFVIHCDGQAEVDHYLEKLTDGGIEVQCGWLKDRYGVSWQVVPKQLLKAIADPDPARAKRAMQAMFTMKKIDIAKIEASARGE
jgi:predicted 3-demethylubiquinone-9 3-methyltransferase (glyoxalase superfamily)